MLTIADEYDSTVKKLNVGIHAVELWISRMEDGAFDVARVYIRTPASAFPASALKVLKRDPMVTFGGWGEYEADHAEWQTTSGWSIEPALSRMWHLQQDEMVNFEFLRKFALERVGEFEEWKRTLAE